MTINEIYKKCCLTLKKSSIDDFEFESRLIIQKCCKLDYNGFLLEKSRSVTECEQTEIDDMIAERISGRPIQYILGEWDFMDLTFRVGEGVLIPRPETEELVEYVADKIRNMEKPIVFDLCSGSGCIGLSIKHLVPQAEVYLVEISDDAIAYLEKNRAALNLTDKVSCIKGDVLGGFEQFSFLPKPNIIVSNPPYISSAQIPTLQKEVLREPITALDGGDDGLIFYHALAEKWLPAIQDGFIAVECGEEQAQTVGSLFSDACEKIEIIKDFNGFDRFVAGFKIAD
ncbi:MAG: peptide chain release factor N(5)-glutamine methyltransferase [Faecalibacterium sp.]|nr:peptide chain release factor N(5)-glutamine methyltransferase [Ruminococcus sp.]MCM1484946.1 peptide chain release factor N(5)-glutamine methyltransferase [Faecalibacterium sp.]